MESNDQSSIFKYFLIISLCLVFVMYWKRKMSLKGESIQDRIWRKIVFAYQDMLHTFDQAEKELLKHTYHNTIFNSKGANVSNDTVINKIFIIQIIQNQQLFQFHNNYTHKESKKKNSNVQFNLNKNETLYY